MRAVSARLRGVARRRVIGAWRPLCPLDASHPRLGQREVQVIALSHGSDGRDGAARPQKRRYAALRSARARVTRGGAATAGNVYQHAEVLDEAFC